ncbi:MAG: response regulator transcription factor [Bacteroidota bacterium]|nr:response regulator transcription factor [Bacteroidota bacterium]
MDIIRLHIVDDHQMMIDGLRALLGDEAPFKIIAESNNGKVALAKIELEQPDVLLTDISMPEMNGLELTKAVKEKFPNIKVIALSMFGERNTISEMLLAGISGYIVKNTGKQELVQAINKVASGGMFFSDEVSAEMMKAISNPPAKEEIISLTPREIEIVKLIAKEYSNLKIADALFISERTVETHRKNIFRKTNTKSVVGLIKYAIEKKMLD